MAVTRNDERSEIHLTDLGVTLRTLLGVAAKGHEVSKRRTWKLMYKDALIGEVKVRTQTLKGSKDGPDTNGNAVRNSKRSKTGAVETKDGARDSVAIREGLSGNNIMGHDEASKREPEGVNTNGIATG